VRTATEEGKMFRRISEREYEERSAGGVRHLFRIDHFVLQDGLDDEGALHHCVIESGDDGDAAGWYLADRATMYEFLARYLAGEYEKKEYELARSPAHETLLDILEEAAARARSGETDFDITEIEEGEPLELEDGSDDDPAER
jgi:hypothetical protein